jgi:hypothetical protein
MLRWVDKLFCLLVCVPPLYMLARFLRWYAKQEAPNQEDAKAES